ncbi:hypothetical protein Tco_0052939 [Tanacetum coccineum]
MKKNVRFMKRSRALRKSRVDTKKSRNGRLDEEALGEHIYEHKKPNASLKNLETQIEQLTKDYQTKVVKKAPSSSTPVGRSKEFFSNNDNQDKDTRSSETNVLHEVFFISDEVVQEHKNMGESASGVLPCQLPLKELNLRSFILPCTIGKPFLATIYARINVFDREISLGVGEDRIVFDINGNDTIAGQKGMPELCEPREGALRLHSCKPIRISGIETCKDGYTNVDKIMKNVVLNEWILDSFDVKSDSLGMSNDPYSRDLEEYKSVFDNEIAQLAEEYELRI